MIDWAVEPYSVYAIIEDGKIIYVGISWKPQQRLRGHKATKLCSKTATIRVLGWYKGIGRARQYERYWIEKYRPPKNKWGKRMPDAQARKIWFSHPRMSKERVIKLMEGWTVWAAYNAFGARGIHEDRIKKRAMRKLKAQARMAVEAGLCAL